MNTEYFVQPNSKGGYDLILLGVKLGAHEIIDLISELKTIGIIPVSAEVTPYFKGDENTPEINENAKKYTNGKLEENYKMSENPQATPTSKPSENILQGEYNLNQLAGETDEINIRDMKIINRQIDFMENCKQVPGESYGEDVSFYEYNYKNVNYHLAKYNELTKRHEQTNSLTRYLKKTTPYYILDGYNGNVPEVDLTWLAPNDKILLHSNEGLNSVRLNVENIEDMYIEKDDVIRNKIGLLNFDISVKPSIRSFFSLTNFIQTNRAFIGKVNIKDSNNKLFNSLVLKFFKLNGLEVTFDKDEITETLNQNYNMSQDPDAKPAIKLSEEHPKTR